MDFASFFASAAGDALTGAPGTQGTPPNGPAQSRSGTATSGSRGQGPLISSSKSNVWPWLVGGLAIGIFLSKMSKRKR